MKNSCLRLILVSEGANNQFRKHSEFYHAEQWACALCGSGRVRFSFTRWPGFRVILGRGRLEVAGGDGMKPNQAERVYEALVAPIEDKMIGMIIRIVAEPSAAEDVLQDALTIIWQKLGRLERHPNPHAYVLRICLSCSVDHLRKQRKRRETALPPVPEHSGVEPPDTLIAQETTKMVRDTITRLPSKQAQAVLLRALQNCSYSEIGEALGCSRGTARSHFSKGIARVRDILNRSSDARSEGDGR